MSWGKNKTGCHPVTGEAQGPQAWSLGDFAEQQSPNLQQATKQSLRGGHGGQTLLEILEMLTGLRDPRKGQHALQKRKGNKN